MLTNVTGQGWFPLGTEVPSSKTPWPLSSTATALAAQINIARNTYRTKTALAAFGPEHYGYRLGLLGAPSRIGTAVALGSGTAKALAAGEPGCSLGRGDSEARLISWR